MHICSLWLLLLHSVTGKHFTVNKIFIDCTYSQIYPFTFLNPPFTGHKSTRVVDSFRQTTFDFTFGKFKPTEFLLLLFITCLHSSYMKWSYSNNLLNVFKIFVLIFADLSRHTIKCNSRKMLQILNIRDSIICEGSFRMLFLLFGFHGFVPYFQQWYTSLFDLNSIIKSAACVVVGFTVNKKYSLLRKVNSKNRKKIRTLDIKEYLASKRNVGEILKISWVC